MSSYTHTAAPVVQCLGLTKTPSLRSPSTLFVCIPILAEVIDFVFSDRLYSAFFPRDIASAATMSLLYVFCASFSAFSVGEARTRPFQPLCREIGFPFLFVFSFFAWFPVPMLSSLFE